MISNKTELKNLILSFTKIDWTDIDNAKTITFEPTSEDINTRQLNERNKLILVINQYLDQELSADPDTSEIMLAIIDWIEKNRNRLGKYIGGSDRINQLRDNINSKISNDPGNALEALKALVLGFITLIITLLSFFFAFRAELKKNADKFISGKLSDEKRHSGHELRISIIEQRQALAENAVTARLDDLNKGIDTMHDLLMTHIQDGINE